MSLRVVARISILPDKVAEAKALLSGLVSPTRKEAGCISYVLLQNSADPSDFTFVEEWESDAALDAHLQTPHLTAALAQIPPMLAAEPFIGRYRVVA